jgi:hypothetical protein
MDSRPSKRPFDEYLGQLSRPLGLAPHEWSDELRQELRQHLEALVAAHIELGSSPEEAVAAALRQFGDPVLIGRRLSRESLPHPAGWPFRPDRRWPRWVIAGVSICAGGLTLASGVASWWFAGHASTPFLENALCAGIVLGISGQSFLMLGGVVGCVSRTLQTARQR